MSFDARTNTVSSHLHKIQTVAADPPPCSTSIQQGFAQRSDSSHSCASQKSRWFYFWEGISTCLNSIRMCLNSVWAFFSQFIRRSEQLSTTRQSASATTCAFPAPSAVSTPSIISSTIAADFQRVSDTFFERVHSETITEASISAVFDKLQSKFTRARADSSGISSNRISYMDHQSGLSVEEEDWYCAGQLRRKKLKDTPVLQPKDL